MITHAPIPRIKVNCGLNRTVKQARKRYRIEHRNVSFSVRGVTWDKEQSTALHEAVKKHVSRYYPGWAITGYAKPKPSTTDGPMPAYTAQMDRAYQGLDNG